MAEPKLVKDYRVGLLEKNGKNYILLTLVTDEGEESFLLEWGLMARSLAVDIMRWNSEISVRKVFTI